MVEERGGIARQERQRAVPERETRAIEELRRRNQEKIRENVDRAHENHKASVHEREDTAKHEALELAHTKEHETDAAALKNEKVETLKTQGIATRSKREQAFTTIMKDIKPHMSPASRTFSNIIHNPIVEKVSDATGKTIARPNAILSGSVCACISVLGVYLIARHYGYPLSGSETIISFALGWTAGIIYDFAVSAYRGGR